MEFKIGKLDGQNFLGDWMLGIYYIQRNWSRLTTDDSSINTDGEHGRTTSPVYARTRVITLEWYIDRFWNNRGQEALEYLQDLFALQSNTGTLIPRKLYITDQYDKEREINVKVKDPIDFVEADEWFKDTAYKWRVVLESIEDPYMLSVEEFVKTGLEWNRGGFSIDSEDGFTMEDGFIMDDYFNFIECVSGWNMESLPRVEITATGNIVTPLTLKNLTNWTYFALDINAVTGDKIIIDSNDYTVTKNWVNIAYARTEWSIWPTINWTTVFGVEDEWGAVVSNDISVSIYFKNCLL